MIEAILADSPSPSPSPINRKRNQTEDSNPNKKKIPRLDLDNTQLFDDSLRSENNEN